jgi:hypothetical protein
LKVHNLVFPLNNCSDASFHIFAMISLLLIICDHLVNLQLITEIDELCLIGYGTNTDSTR